MAPAGTIVTQLLIDRIDPNLRLECANESGSVALVCFTELLDRVSTPDELRCHRRSNELWT